MICWGYFQQELNQGLDLGIAKESTLLSGKRRHQGVFTPLTDMGSPVVGIPPVSPERSQIRHKRRAPFRFMTDGTCGLVKFHPKLAFRRLHMTGGATAVQDRLPIGSRQLLVVHSSLVFVFWWGDAGGDEKGLAALIRNNEESLGDGS